MVRIQAYNYTKFSPTDVYFVSVAEHLLHYWRQNCQQQRQGAANTVYHYASQQKNIWGLNAFITRALIPWVLKLFFRISNFFFPTHELISVFTHCFSQKRIFIPLPLVLIRQSRIIAVIFLILTSWIHSHQVNWGWANADNIFLIKWSETVAMLIFTSF